VPDEAAACSIRQHRFAVAATDGSGRSYRSPSLIAPSVRLEIFETPRESPDALRAALVSLCFSRRCRMLPLPRSIVPRLLASPLHPPIIRLRRVCPSTRAMFRLLHNQISLRLPSSPRVGRVILPAVCSLEVVPARFPSSKVPSHFRAPPDRPFAVIIDKARRRSHGVFSCRTSACFL